jgi:large subunit ribosomal protein L21
MTYAIIEVAGKQYRVREGERLLVDRLPEEDGAAIAPTVLLVGGDGVPVLEPAVGAVTARVVGAAKGPKIRIGKYKKRTGYRRHTGFRASLTQIEIESIGGKPARAASKAKPEKATEAPRAGTSPEKAPPAAPPEEFDAGTAAQETISGIPAGYPEMTIADLKGAVAGWSAEELSASLAYEREHGNRKGAIAALEAALSKQGGES